MIIPTKHIHFSESLLGFGGYVLQKLNSKKTVDQLWNEYQADLTNRHYETNHNFDHFLLTLVFLYAVGAIDEREGRLGKCV